MTILEIRVEEEVIRSFGRSPHTALRSPHTALTQPWLLYQGYTCVSVTFSGHLRGYYKGAEMGTPWRVRQCTSVRSWSEGGTWKGKPGSMEGATGLPSAQRAWPSAFKEKPPRKQGGALY